ncbi:hypothetical protein [Edaphobacter modestus]|uniref:Uncharacterized protein n=1 Tax=Edaphobacter modestus TaxID=388466 RepID=A0A4Q7YQ50_9BACT|nr:hypothetical protein [Edaphobacter modestus]RZU39892.1 hypothetical protein BDD14_1287 [Edaphobacter modestus]
MHLPLTFGLLGLLTGAVVVLRLLWWRMPWWLRRSILATACALVLLRIGSIATQWSFTSTRLNAVICWTAVAGYEVLLARFSLMRPRWLTSISAIVLVVPLIGSTLLIPLTRIFDWSAADISELAGPYILEKSPWDTGDSGNAGVDLYVFYRPPLIPFIRHMSQRASFGDDVCNPSAASAELDPKKRTAHFHCPAKGDGKPPIDVILPLR